MTRVRFLLWFGLATAPMAMNTIGHAQTAQWAAVNRLQDERTFATATLLTSGKVLVVGGQDSSRSSLATAELYDTDTGIWIYTGSLNFARSLHTATLLPSGRVLVVGGVSSAEKSEILETAELYDPMSGTWQQVEKPSVPRYKHTATLLTSGEVLVVGGSEDEKRGEIFNPINEIWQSTGEMSENRLAHTATLLPSGNVLIAGGLPSDSRSIDPSTTAEIYGHASGAWIPTGSLSEGRESHTATLLSSGQVLVAAGRIANRFRTGTCSCTESSEVYDPLSGVWSQTGSLKSPRDQHTATLLPSGKIIVTGGLLGESRSTEIYNPENGLWKSTGKMIDNRGTGHTATLLPTGKLLIVGGIFGHVLSAAEIFYPFVDDWSQVMRLNKPIYSKGVTGTLLPSGRVLFVGSQATNIFDPSSNRFTNENTPSIRRQDHTATLLPEGNVLVVGGLGLDGEPLQSAEIYNSSTNTWRQVGSLAHARTLHTATLLSSGKVLVTGGVTERGEDEVVISESELYDPLNKSWSPGGSLIKPRVYHSATLLASGKVLVAGGSAITPNSIYGSAQSDATSQLYDPATDSWSLIGSLRQSRANHTATLLPSGKVLVTAGYSRLFFEHLASSEIYDPERETWTLASSLSTSRFDHSALLLRSGEVLVAGGHHVESNYFDLAFFSTLSTAEIYEPFSDIWTTLQSSDVRKAGHTSTLLPSGQVLTAYGELNHVAELFTPRIVLDSRRPVITERSEAIRHGNEFVIKGLRLYEHSEGTAGGFSSSATNYPLVHVMPIEESKSAWLTPDPKRSFYSEDATTITVSEIPKELDPGLYLLTVYVAGVPSKSEIVSLECSLAVEGPVDQTAAIGSTATFTITEQGARSFQWQKNGNDIPGANGPSYTTPPVTASDSGSDYRVVVSNGCRQVTSAPAELIVEDNEPPQAEIMAPSGGEFWLLSDVDETARSEIISWSMSDNVRICQVRVSLLLSRDGGQTYEPTPPGGGLPATFGRPVTCEPPGETATSLQYALPDHPPAGGPGAIYKIELEVTDHAGLVTTLRSLNPFFIVKPNPDSIKTLILMNTHRMASSMGISPARIDDLVSRFEELADHPRVQGLVVDLAGVTTLSTLYHHWDSSPMSVHAANAVLFDEGGVHDHVRSLLRSFTGVKHLMLVGGDDVIPMARVRDGAILFSERNYIVGATEGTIGSLTPQGTTVGSALAANRYLSDDPLATIGEITPDDLEAEGHLYIPDIAVGRLVEKPDEMTKAVATFIGQDGVLDLATLDSQTGHKVLVSGYDFLVDSGASIRAQWKSAFGLPEPHEDEALSPVDGVLLSSNWGESSVEDRRAVFHSHLSGHGVGRYAIVSPNGHATHFELGVPGLDRLDIQGLRTVDMYGRDDCRSPLSGYAPLDLSGSLVYAIGCHGGLSVPGSCFDDAEHSLDLPQTMLALGVQAYIANTGYGWGLLNGIGLSERMVEIFTEELVRGGTVVVGEAMKRAKLRYHLESPRFDAYDAKTSMQWTLFGFPMYSIKTGITGEEKAVTSTDLFRKAATRISELPAIDHIGPVKIERKLSKNPDASVPPFLTRVEHRFDFTGEGVYTKRNAAGDLLERDVAGCPDPAGCYYTLNGLATGTPDLPIEPYFVFDSRLSGTSQHGILWKGGTWDQESGWVPLFAELASNGGDGSNHGATPRRLYIRPRGRHRRILGGESEDCRASDLELFTVVLTTGEVLKPPDDDTAFSISRLHRTVDLEVFYFNNTEDGTGNCERSGPLFGDGPYHTIRGTSVEWAVPVSDAAGVWRVVVVYTDGTADEEGQGRWVPLELADDGAGVWQGRLRLDGAAQLTYYLQAVDRRGNVSWLEFEGAEKPSSGVDLGIPLPVDVAVLPGTADLAVQLLDDPDPVSTGGRLIYVAQVSNAGPDPASSLVATFMLPGGAAYVFGGGEEWSCDPLQGEVVCTRESLDPGATSQVSLLMAAPARTGTFTSRVTVSAVEDDPVGGNDSATQQTRVRRP